MNCYACDNAATQRCSRCGNPYCRDHGDDPTGGQALCAECLNPLNAAPSGAVFRASLLALLVGSVIALWLLVRPPSLPGESSEAIIPFPSPEPSPVVPLPSPTPTEAPPPVETPPPAPPPEPPPPPPGPIEYTVVENDTWFGIADAFGVDAEQLAAFNGRTLDDFIQPGEVLLIPQ